MYPIYVISRYGEKFKIFESVQKGHGALDVEKIDPRLSKAADMEVSQ